jgi:acyl transferase domain-containing protein
VGPHRGEALADPETWIAILSGAGAAGGDVDENALVCDVLPRAPGGRTADLRSAVLQQVAALWVSGEPIAWNAIHARGAHRKALLPTYPFDRTPFWAGRGPNALELTDTRDGDGVHEILNALESGE